MRWAAFLQIDLMYIRFPRQVAADRQAKKGDCVVLLEKLVRHLQVMLNISFEARVKNTLCFGGVERDKPNGAPF